jgi:hypothetical protein
MTTEKIRAKPEPKTTKKLQVRASGKSKAASTATPVTRCDNIEPATTPFDIKDSGKNWPKGADFEEFYNAIQSGRQYGRKYGEK